MMRYYVELRMKPDDPIYPNVSFYVKGWSIEQVRDMFCEEDIVAVEQTD